ncbi:hypothetical protein SAMN05421595_0173 [Austwickia chelonae]|uniref:Uncharacterized protein n=1 Tax=Austwickia chelonae NBRC 105200 TaxID=1184607 RepID=K6V9P9_9MICO|nr:hypothetical protein AUCHE_17_01720 [Austwickia chelonae NBRC 105200]SEV87300.1 hypothetical protein SAMN05421595_0173 [Austwickia chelonae]
MPIGGPVLPRGSYSHPLVSADGSLVQRVGGKGAGPAPWAHAEQQRRDPEAGLHTQGQAVKQREGRPLVGLRLRRELLLSDIRIRSDAWDAVDERRESVEGPIQLEIGREEDDMVDGARLP